VSDRRERLHASVLYLVCDAQPDAFLREALRGGVDIVQLRVKDGSDGAIFETASRYRRLCTESGALLIINDRPDLARAADADGVHIGQDDDPVRTARALVGPDRLIGLSAHSPEQVTAAGRVGVDYIGVGPVHATPTKPGRPAVGLELVHYAATHSVLPFFAIGGITTENIAAVRAAGARRAAVVRALTEASDPEAAARKLHAGLTGERTSIGAA
jgi:thiamine-phosphate pyrophosphorylase